MSEAPLYDRTILMVVSSNMLILTQPLSCNLAHVRHSRPDSSLGFQVKSLHLFQVVSCSLGSGHKYPPRISTAIMQKLPIIRVL